MKANLSEFQLGINQEEAQELLGQLTGITHNNLVIAADLLSAQFAELKQITYGFIKLRKLAAETGDSELHGWNQLLCDALALPLFKIAAHVKENQSQLTDAASCREFIVQFYADTKFEQLLEQYKQHEAIKHITETLDVSADVFGRLQKSALKGKKMTAVKLFSTANTSQVFTNLPSLDVAVLAGQSPEADETVKQILGSYLSFFQVFIQPMINVGDMIPLIEEQLDRIANFVPEDKDAISKMKQSLFLLKDNFAKYYKNMVSSKGSAQTFILDFLYDVYELVKDQDRETREANKVSGKKPASRAKILQQFTHLSRFIQQNVLGGKEGKVSPQIHNMIKTIEDKIQRLVATVGDDDSDDSDETQEEHKSV